MLSIMWDSGIHYKTSWTNIQIINWSRRFETVQERPPVNIDTIHTTMSDLAATESIKEESIENNCKTCVTSLSRTEDQEAQTKE